eukprot:TRINITY_DN64043_c0_g1_i1.p1 TRINITY_DN64043_c0_g1~~TRINITY_DN64043_c0_g1_i1.p1  ORF type:complete len:269 (-),score=44.82 TRINITY_DN64043_c0_g1_i1:95-901(-)
MNRALKFFIPPASAAAAASVTAYSQSPLRQYRHGHCNTAAHCVEAKTPSKDHRPPVGVNALYADLMHRRREVWLTGVIDTGVAKEVISQLRYLEYEDPGKPITLLINSPGGKVGAGLAIHDIMQDIQSPVRTFCVGRCSSMAAVILSAGEKGHRHATLNSRIMVHEPRVALPSKLKSKGLQVQHTQIEVARITTQRILAENCQKSEEEIERLLEAEDHHMSADEAKELGLIDFVGSSKATCERKNDQQVLKESGESQDTAPIPERTKM